LRDTELPLYVEIAESIRRRILSAELKPGDRLLSIREQAERWHCTPGTVSRAYATLAKEGLVEGHRGAGSRVTLGALQTEPEPWRWAELVNMAERYLLDALHSGYQSSEAETALALAIARLEDLRATPTATAPRSIPSHSLCFVGSHDLVVELLPRLLAAQAPEVTFSAKYVGSLGGLIALSRGEADLAGIHLWDADTDSYNLPFVRRILPGRVTVLLTLFQRSLGLIVQQGNEQQLQGLADLSKSGVRMVNRQEGSGTRVWLDAQLRILGLDAARIAGYERTELTHLTAARAVADGEATVGLGIEAAALAYGLDFVPLTKEQYDLAIPGEIWASKAIQALVTTVQSEEFSGAVRALGGYDLEGTGRETRVA
jgi:molybdate-binding protein/DNA-binding transcriptional regulator YhcF (GntR family)